MQALGRKYQLREALAPGCEPLDLLEMVQWPHGKSPVLVVGHQPTLGRVIAHLLGLSADECAVRKGAVWWLRHRERNGVAQTVLMTVQAPELL